MKRRSIAITLLVVVVAMGTISCSKQEAKMQPGKQTTCPVMKGKPINPDLYADANGKRIYVCCAGCIAPIKADPDKYIQQMEAEGITLEKVPKKEEADDHSGHQH